MAGENENKGIFNLASAEDFFLSLKIALVKYRKSTVKELEVALFLVMGVNHLREWIAPDYDPRPDGRGRPKNTPKNAAERFYVAIFDGDFKLVNQLCNRSKHLKKIDARTGLEGGLNIDEWPDSVDDLIGGFDQGPPTAFLVNEQDIGDVLERILNRYEKEWFGLQTPGDDFA